MRIKDYNTIPPDQLATYPVDRIRETAGNILSNASSSLAQHERAWANVQSYIGRFPGFMQGPVRALFSVYEARLRASYHWQMDYAKSLSDTADALETTETGITNSFK